MAEVAAIAGLASAGATIFGGFSKNKTAGMNADNLREEGDMARRIYDYNAEMARQTGEFEGAQLDRAAIEERIAGQFAAREKQLDLDRVLSAQRARAASGGAGGVGTAGVLDIMGDTYERGKYLKDIETYNAETKARGRMDQAAMARAKAIAAAHGLELQGEAAQKKAYSAADVTKKEGKNSMFGSILEGGSKALTAGYNYYK